MTNEEAGKLAEAHWKWLKPVLLMGGCLHMELIHYLYVTAMIHGIKHGEKVK